MIEKKKIIFSVFKIINKILYLIIKSVYLIFNCLPLKIYVGKHCNRLC